MKIEAVVTSVDHADFLCHTLPHNKAHFDRLVVVTAPEDHATRKVCDAWGVRAKCTDAFLSRWGNGVFLKGCGVNEGLRLLDRDEWIVHMDADVILPPHFRATIELCDLDTTMIYGIDRQCFRSYADWMSFYESPAAQIEDDLLIHTANGGQQLGARVFHPERQGWFPIGFFQLWHGDSGILEYDADQKTAVRDDSNFACRWPRKKRALIPEIIAYHLESEAAPMGKNWAGRKTKPFRSA